MDFHRVLADWVGSEYRQSLADLLAGRGLNRDIALADLGAGLTRSLHLFIKDNVWRDWNERLVETVFGAGENSVVNCLGRGRMREVEAQLVGPISVLTFADLTRGAKPDVPALNLSEVLAPGWMDAKDKVDIKLEGSKGRSLIQLKSIREDDVRIERVIPGEVRNDYFGVVMKRDAIKLLEKAQKFGAKAFVVLVPQYDTASVRNIWGIIRRGNTLGADVAALFAEEAEKFKLLPY